MRRPDTGDELPLEYENEEKQEALRFLCSKMDARPMIRGISDEERLEAWTEVAKDLNLGGPQRRAIRLRHKALAGEAVDEDTGFSPASTLEAAPETEAVPDGGADVGAAQQAAQDATEEPEQETMEYEDDAEYESQLRDAERLCRMFDDADVLEEKIDQEREREVVRPHVIEALQMRLEEVQA